jgi:hypothetical protein
MVAFSMCACADPPGPEPAREVESDPLAATRAGLADPDSDPLRDQLEAIPGLTVVAELPVPPSLPAGTRFFSLELTQPASHLRPGSPTFQQRATLLVRDPAAPTVLFSTGYDLPIAPFRTEITRALGANQLGIEHRFFAPSRPEPANWRDLTILQAAFDHHRFVQRFQPLLTGKWISTGGSKGGMTSVYHRRFFPADVAATVAYVAPHDVIDRVDRYVDFIDRVGPSPACRAALETVQRQALERRDQLVPLMVERGLAQGYRFGRVLQADQAFEYTVLEMPFLFWQYGGAEFCSLVPGPDAPTEDLYAFLDAVVGLSYFSDETSDFYAPYYYAAATQINYPTVKTAHVAPLLRHLPAYKPRTMVPPEIPVPAPQPLAMIDVDLWVRFAGSRLMFIYGENDPWSAEPFRLGPGTRDSYTYTVAAGNHGARIGLLPAEQRAEIEATLRRWAGLPPAAPAAALAAPDADADADADEVAADHELMLRPRRGLWRP